MNIGKISSVSFSSLLPVSNSPKKTPEKNKQTETADLENKKYTAVKVFTAGVILAGLGVFLRQPIREMQIKKARKAQRKLEQESLKAYGKLCRNLQLYSQELKDKIAVSIQSQVPPALFKKIKIKRDYKIIPMVQEVVITRNPEGAVKSMRKFDVKTGRLQKYRFKNNEGNVVREWELTREGEILKKFRYFIEGNGEAELIRVSENNMTKGTTKNYVIRRLYRKENPKILAEAQLLDTRGNVLENREYFYDLNQPGAAQLPITYISTKCDGTHCTVSSKKVTQYFAFVPTRKYS